ncbi:hypothetical protein GWO43_16145 [candidate division KSB1 bacterium]|nr:hypothetical protein [candidate division KSB1 bacterium]NIV68765.1 hypothetical protein [Phycisphaerae bacterium]NIS25482.1 hypothetical protein [candidate division KSB1 bacterium]NIT72375.1 hypothetical protein [candidate division KSB1 bacterium]NIU26159.1 hypothetical protein [candidate division KSB1 bacterium]
MSSLEEPGDYKANKKTVEYISDLQARLAAAEKIAIAALEYCDSLLNDGAMDGVYEYMMHKGKPYDPKGIHLQEWIDENLKALKGEKK